MFLLLAAAVSCCAQAPLVANVGNFIHPVANLERSTHFYRDVIGMDMPRPAGAAQTTEAVLKMYDASGGKFIVANAQIPGSPMRLEMVEFQGVERVPLPHKWGAAGSSVLMLTVADLGPVEQRLVAANAPMPVKTTKACDGRGLVTEDPDGSAVMVVERGAPGTASNFTGLRFGYVVSNEATAQGPFAALGLKAETRTHVCQPIEEALFGQRSSIVQLPNGFEVWLVKGSTAAEHVPARQRDPGTAVLRLMVTDVDAAVKALNAAQVKVVSEGGVVQTLPPGTTRAGILGAPDDLFIQVVK